MITRFNIFENDTSRYTVYSSMVKSTAQDLITKYEVDISMHYDRFTHAIILSKIKVPEHRRNKGVGSSVMHDLCLFADVTGMKIGLTPTDDFGGNLSKLRSFYRNFDFVRNKDHELSESMVRFPKTDASDNI